MRELIRHIIREHTKEIGEERIDWNTELFIKRAKEVHGNKFDYSNLDYKGSRNKVNIICPIHGEFLQLPQNHLKGQGCAKCAQDLSKTTQRKSDDFFMKKAKEVHGNKYDYTKTRYVNYSTPITVTCPIHGDFIQKGGNHLSGQGCPKCAVDLRRVDSDDFIKRAKETHGNKYNYSEVNFKKMDKPVTIICPLHGKFSQSPSNHISGQQCPICARIKANDKHRVGTDKFIERSKEVHGEKYDYSDVDYKTLHGKVKIICPIHGGFLQSPGSHLNGNGCPKCGGVGKVSTNEFIERAKNIHGDKFDYSKVKLDTMSSPVTIICKKHGEFKQQPNNHLSGQGCPYCQESKGENFVVKLLNNNDISFVRQKVFDDCTSRKEKYCRKLPFDFYLPNTNSIIEYDGRQHFEPVWGEDNLKRTKETDKIKNQYCKEKGIKLIRIPYTMKKQDIEPYILSELGM